VYEEKKDEILIGFKGPYGGIYSNHELNFSILQDLYSELISYQKPIRIRIAPAERFPKTHHYNLKTLTELGFKIVYKEINQNINTNNLNFNRNRLRDFKKSINLNYTFNASKVESAYEIISKNRINKGLKLSIKLEYLLEMMNLRGDLVSSYSVSNKNSLLCAAIVIKVTDNYSYVYAWGHDQDVPNSGTSLSLLVRNLVISLNANLIENLSLGTSSISGEVDQGLFKFKESLGAKPEEILVLEYLPD
jgi:hypothetical protein